MRLELTSEEGRVLDALTHYVLRDQELAMKVFAGDQYDLKVFSEVAGKVRAEYTWGKMRGQ